MVNALIVRDVVGLIGNVIYFGLLLSPIPTLVKIIKKRDVEEFKSDTYIAIVLNCAFWVFHGLPFVHPDRILVVTNVIGFNFSFDIINGIGLVLGFFYLTIFYICANNEGRELLINKAFFFGFVILVTMFTLDDTNKRSLVVRIICNFLNVIMYVSPLAVMENVIKTKSVKYMPFLPSLAIFLNGLCWTTYALINPFDIYLLVSNGIGAISGFVQLILYVYFWCKGENKNDDANHDSDSAV